MDITCSFPTCNSSASVGHTIAMTLGCDLRITLSSSAIISGDRIGWTQQSDWLRHPKIKSFTIVRVLDSLGSTCHVGVRHSFTCNFQKCSLSIILLSVVKLLRKKRAAAATADAAGPGAAVDDAGAAEDSDS